MKIKITAYLLTIGLFFLSFILLFIAEQLLLDEFWISTDSFSQFLSIYALTTLALPSLGSYIISRRFVLWFQKRKRISVKWCPQNRGIIFLLIVLYLLTAIAGSPSVQNHNTKWAIDEYKRIHKGDSSEVWESHPYIGTYLSVPVLPFIVLSYHEYQLAGLYGWGGWDFQIWYLTGVKRILSLQIWIS